MQKYVEIHVQFFHNAHFSWTCEDLLYRQKAMTWCTCHDDRIKRGRYWEEVSPAYGNGPGCLSPQLQEDLIEEATLRSICREPGWRRPPDPQVEDRAHQCAVKGEESTLGTCNSRQQQSGAHLAGQQGLQSFCLPSLSPLPSTCCKARGSLKGLRRVKVWGDKIAEEQGFTSQIKCEAFHNYDRLNISIMSIRSF